jgi:hypothetical protein
MNNFFNVKRFGLVLKKDFLENWKRYLLYFIVLFGIMALIMIFTANDAYRAMLIYGRFPHPGLNTQLLQIASFSFLAGGLLFASTAMDTMKRKTQRVSYLILPASNFEKYFSRWLIVMIGYIIAFFIALWLADFMRVLVCSMRYPTLEINALDMGEIIKTVGGNPDSLDRNKSIFAICISLYLLFQSIFVLGTLFWEKLSFIKTFAVSSLVVTGFILICRWAVLSFYPGDFDQLGNVLNSFRIDEKITESQAYTIFIVTLLVFTLANWIISYFRFKESEIIKRW